MALTPDPDWWRGAVIYQIYPRSYQDTNGDGVGDLPGIIQRLPYIAWLGVDAIWISPISTSPMKDYGYDVSDYCGIDPLFGTLADFDRLIATAHDLGLRVMTDLVISHTSDQHPWFIESRADRTNPRSDWYVWADPKLDGNPPNNWLSIFGGPAWHWDGRREQYYLHNFLVSQPDLNFHNPDVQDALLDVARFWMERGVDGFRLDTINFYFADKDLRSNPGLPLDQRNASIAPSVNPYNHQDHLYDKNQPENLAFLRRLRALMDLYPDRAAVGEVGDAQRGMEIMGQYTAGDDLMHMCYAFEFLSGARPKAAWIAGVLQRFAEAAPDGWPCWAYSNHDVIRHATRWSLDEAGCRIFLDLMLCLRGSVCLYQGEELGLPEADIAFDDLQDPYGIEFWPEFKGRDGCRTPMPWSAQAEYGGFSEVKPWLPVPPEHLERAVDRIGETGLTQHYRARLALRRTLPALAKGTMSEMAVNGEVLSFSRIEGGQTVYCAFNIGPEPAPITLPAGRWTRADTGDALGEAETLGPDTSLIAVAH